MPDMNSYGQGLLRQSVCAHSVHDGEMGTAPVRGITCRFSRKWFTGMEATGLICKAKNHMEIQENEAVIISGNQGHDF